jgi:Na+-translocating ferredoxin:NAD+ oxidoreductase RnfG subunit
MIERRAFLTALPVGLLLSSETARATTYFTADAIKHALFPAATRFVDRSIMLTKDQMKAIAKAATTRVSFPRIVAMDAFGPAGKLGTLFIDKVYGKHEFITYAVALDPAGAVKSVEIMDYRESYGDQVRMPKWRAQFSGKRHGQPIMIDKQIKNISGATLSCVHVTEGVRRLLATYALALPSV